MAEWKRVKIGDFLRQYRVTIFVDDSKEYKQITISKKDGVQFRGVKNGKEIGRKRQFMIDLKNHPHTLTFTRQGVADGSIGLAPEEVDGCIATENMPMFDVDVNTILPDFLAYFLKSPVFFEKIGEITPTGSAQKSIHEDDLLKIEVSLPDLEHQKSVLESLNKKIKTILSLEKNLANQKKLIKQLRQSVLQDAIEGKLTEDWRKKHPVIKGDINYDAEALYNHIRQEKQNLIAAGKIKKEKPLPEIKVEDLDFEIPESWKWVKMGELCFPITKGTTPNTSEINQVGEIPYLKMYNIVDQKIDFDHRSQFISKDVHEKILARSKVYPNDVIMNIVGPPLGKIGIIPNEYPEWNLNQAMAIFRTYHNKMYRYVYLFLCSLVWVHKVQVLGVVGQDNVSLEECKNICIPLPPLEEQLFLTDFVNKRLLTIDELEQQIVTRETYAKTLLQTTLQTTFQEG